MKTEGKFLDSFENIKYRYLDLTGKNRIPICLDKADSKLNQDGYDSFFTVNGFSGNEAKKENLINLNSFFIDVDKKLSEEEIKKIKDILDPTFIIETFNGFHFYWVLDEVIFKEENENDWNEIVARWERIEQSIVDTIPEADKQVKDLTRILRVPNTIYWKKTKGEFKIKGCYKEFANTYSMDQMEEAFPVKEKEITKYEALPNNDKILKYAEAEKKDFFSRVNQKYPIEERPSFKKLVSGMVGTLPIGEGQRNQALLITASLMRQAGWSKKKAIDQISEVGWHGIEKERGGSQEILTTINSAYSSGYVFSYKNEIISHNMDAEEQRKIQEAYTAVQKDRKELDKTRYSNYEYEILAKYPYIRKNEIGIIFNYENGVYKMMSDQEVNDLVYIGLYEDMLWGYRTKKSVADKVACLLSIIPNLKLSEDGGQILNVKNGLLNIYTRVLKPHTPDFVSLIQSPMIYDENATCPTWDSCMDAWMEGNEKEEKTLLLQQYSGYILSSSMLYDRALFLVGDGGNGKSTFIDTIAMVIGDNSTSHIDLESLYGQYGLKGLIGKRLNIIEEVAGNYYQSSKLKKLISGEPITIDMKYKDQFDFRPQCKFVFAVNNMPRIDDSSTATERRICVIEFLNNFRNNPNTQLRSKMGLLAKELSGILNWMLDGAQKLSDMKKFVTTKEQTKLLTEYRMENSSVEGFIGECLEFKEGEEITSRDVYDKYRQYCNRDGKKSKAKITFTKEIISYGKRNGKFQFIERKYGADTSRFEGICFNEEWKQDDYQKRLNDF